MDKERIKKVPTSKNENFFWRVILVIEIVHIILICIDAYQKSM
nr:MAG TPA: hypothetical protein [Caudoviricetes sp.]